jgi:translation initiation factor 3 subunit K
MSATSEWVTPLTRPELIESLVSGVGQCHFQYPYFERFLGLSDRYNPSNVGILEDYLFHQIRSREYDCLANLAILKLSVPFVFSFYQSRIDVF